MAGIKIEGLEELQKALKKNVTMDDVKRVVRKNGSDLQGLAQDNAPVGTPESTGIPGYVGGTLKRSIKYKPIDSGFGAEIKANAEYSAYVEYGTRFMNARPYMKPAEDVQRKKFISDMEKLVDKKVKI